MAGIDFLRTAWKDMAQTGSVWESSRFLVQKLLKPIDWQSTSRIIELGTGTGVITSEILKHMQAGTAFAAYEINAEFFAQTLERIHADDRCLLLMESAEYLRPRHSPGTVDVVVSSLPLSIIPDATREAILLEIYSVLREGGTFIQYQYAPTRFRMINKLYSKVRLNYTLRNIPPAFISICTK